MDDLRHVEVEGKPIARAHGDARQFLIELVRLGPRRPIEHDVGRGHQLDFHHTRVDRMFAGIERRDPDALVSGIHEVAMAELGSADVDMRLTRHTR